MFDIAIDPARKLMTVNVAGFWDQRTFESYAAEAAARSEGCCQSNRVERAERELLPRLPALKQVNGNRSQNAPS